MPETRRAMLGIACSWILCASAVAATDEKRDEMRTEELRVERIGAQDALLAVRTIAGVREIEVHDLHTLSIHDLPDKLLLARWVVELLDHPRSVSRLHGARKVDEETMIASFALRQTSARDAMRLLMSRIAIRKVAAVEANETVVFRDTREQGKAAFDLLDEFDRTAP
ncbi:MAG: hypothetical protein ABI689_00940 [Thermoanaerobaculia bacterium]